MTTPHDPIVDTREGVEPEGISVLSVLSMTGISAVILVAIVLAGMQLASAEFRRAEAAAVEQTGYPALQETRIAAEARLSRYEVVDEAARRYRIPVDRAVDLIVDEAGNHGDETITTELRLTR